MFDSDTLRFLARSDAFNQLLESDPVLQELQSEIPDRLQEQRMLLQMAHSAAPLLPERKKSAKVLTGALWVFLWTMGNAYTEDFRKVTQEDTGIFLYLMEQDLPSLSIKELRQLRKRGHDYCRKHSPDLPRAAAELMQLIRETFQVLQVLPAEERSSSAASSSSGKSFVFDLYWLTLISSIVAEQSNHTLAEVMFVMPLSLLFHCFLACLKKSDRNHSIRRRFAEERVSRIMERVRCLGEEFLLRHGKETVPTDENDLPPIKKGCENV